MKPRPLAFVAPIFAIVCACILVAAPRSPEQNQSSMARGQSPPNPSIASPDYVIGPGDILDIDIAAGLMSKEESEALSNKFRVSENGEIQIPTVPEPIRAEGLTGAQLSDRIARALQAAKQFRDPTVRVYVEEYHSRNVTVLGAVQKPAVYPLQKETTLLEALSNAGGLAQNAGNTVTIVHGMGAKDARSASPSNQPETIDLAALVKGKAPSLNVKVRDGDVIDVAVVPIVYVVGAVNKAGGFPVLDPSSGITVLQALALAEGPNSIAATNRSLIVRTSEGAGRHNIPVDVSKIMRGNGTDLRLEPNDILFIPESGMKRNEQRMAQVAMAMVNGISVYGIGYRVAGIP